MNILWPNISDEKTTLEAAKQGWVASIFIAAMTILSIIVGWTSVMSVVDVVLISLIGFGCFKMSRIAAVLGVILCIYNGIDKYIEKNTVGMMPIFTLFFINAARGTFKYHKIKNNKLEESRATPEQG